MKQMVYKYNSLINNCWIMYVWPISVFLSLVDADVNCYC